MWRSQLIDRVRRLSAEGDIVSTGKLEQLNVKLTKMERQRSQDFSAVQPQDDGGAQLEESDDSDDGHDHDHDQEDHEEDTGAADACADGHRALDCAHVREVAGRQAGRRRGTRCRVPSVWCLTLARQIQSRSLRGLELAMCREGD